MKMKLKKPRKEVTMIILVIMLLTLSYLAPKLNKNDSDTNTEKPKIEESIKNIEQPISDTIAANTDSNRSNTKSIIGLVVWAGIFGAALYYFNRYSKKEDLGFIKISSKKKDGKQLLTFVIYNFSKKGITVNAPVIEFTKGEEVRKFKITGIANHNIYPMFIPEKQGQKLTTTLDQFFYKVPELSNFKSYRIVVTTQNNRVLKSFSKKI